MYECARHSYTLVWALVGRYVDTHRPLLLVVMYQAEKFMDVKPNKILTVATTGLVIALPMAKVCLLNTLHGYA